MFCMEVDHEYLTHSGEFEEKDAGLLIRHALVVESSRNMIVMFSLTANLQDNFGISQTCP